MKLLCAPIAAFTLMCAPGALAAQSSAPEMVSRRQVEEITGAPLLIGRLPARLENRLYLPPTSRVIGSSGTSALIGSSVPAATLLAEWEREMPRRGWQLLAHSRPDWGFVNADRPLLESGLVFCGHDTWLTVTPVDSAAETRLRVSAISIDGCQGITLMSQGPMRMPPAYDPIPVRLVNPVGARPSPYEQCPYSMNGNNAQNFIETGLTVDSLMAHYGRQLADAGWLPSAPAGLIRSWTRPDSAGKPVQIDVRIESRPDAPRCRDLSYRIRPVKP